MNELPSDLETIWRNITAHMDDATRDAMLPSFLPEFMAQHHRRTICGKKRWTPEERAEIVEFVVAKLKNKSHASVYLRKRTSPDIFKGMVAIIHEVQWQRMEALLLHGYVPELDKSRLAH